LSLRVAQPQRARYLQRTIFIGSRKLKPAATGQYKSITYVEVLCEARFLYRGNQLFLKYFLDCFIKNTRNDDLMDFCFV